MVFVSFSFFSNKNQIIVDFSINFGTITAYRTQITQKTRGIRDGGTKKEL